MSTPNSASSSESQPGLLVNQIYTQDELHAEVISVCDEAIQIFSFDANLCEQISVLKSFANEMIPYLHEYDINPAIQANGYRSILLSGITLIEYGIKKCTESNANSAFICDFKALIKNCVSGISYVRRLREESVKHANERDAENNLLPDLASSTGTLVDFFYDYITADNAKEIYFSWHSFLDINPLIKLAMLISFIGSSIEYSNSLISSIRSVLDSEYRRKKMAQVMNQITIGDLKQRMESLGKNYLYRTMYPNYINGNKPAIQEIVNIKCYNKVVIEFDHIKMEPPTLRIRSEEEVSKLDNKYIKCKLLYEPIDPTLGSADRPLGSADQTLGSADPKTLIINVHGGGFCLGNMESNDIYLRDWARKTPGVGVLSIDISNCPEKKFPAATQDVVDVYLTLVTTDGAENILGFKPRQIFLSGDSSGGYQTMAALVVLSEINKLSPGLIKMMPKAMIQLYSSYDIATSMKPSYMMCVSSHILNPVVLALFGDSYLPYLEGDDYNQKTSDADTRANEEDANLEDFYISSYIKYFGRQLMQIGRSFKKTLIKSASYIVSTEGLQDPTPTFPPLAQSKEQMLRRARACAELTRHPFVSPLYYEDFESLSGVTLYQACCQLDPILDHSVSMGKKWKGPLIVDVFNNMHHGFLNAMILKIVRDANDVIVKRIQELCYE